MAKRGRPRGIPKPTRHRASGRAVVRLDGTDHYLGPWGSTEAEAAYHRLVAEWLARRPAPISADERPATIAELAAEYWAHAVRYYRRDGRPTTEVGLIRLALRPLAALYGDLPVAEFGPLKLKAVRQRMIAAGLARTTINGHVGRIRRLFAWATENERIDGTVYVRLRAVAGLRRGRGGRETARRQAVAWDRIEAVRPHVSRQVWAMISIQWLTGMRPGEVLGIRGADLDRSGDVWLYRPAHHKAEHHGRERIVAIGPRGRKILTPWLRPDPETYLFRPDEAEATRSRRRREERRTPLGPTRRKRRRRRRRPPGEQYTTAAYRRAVTRACRRAGIEPWTPHQVRHAYATRAAARFGEIGLEAVRAALGHADTRTTSIYLHGDAAEAAEVARRIG